MTSPRGAGAFAGVQPIFVPLVMTGVLATSIAAAVKAAGVCWYCRKAGEIAAKPIEAILSNGGLKRFVNVDEPDSAA